MSVFFDDGKQKLAESAVDNATRLAKERCLAAIEETRDKYKGHYAEHVIGWVCNDIKARIEAKK